MPVLSIPRGQPFSLDQTLGCGQVFRWDRAADGTWTGVVGNSVIRIRQDNRTLTFDGASETFVREYFSLDVDLGLVLASIDRDPCIHTAIRSCTGLRLIRQPKWECLVSYICATNSNIPAIRKRIAHLAEQFGDAIETDEGIWYSFPDSYALSCKGSTALDGCKLGYRSPYVFKTACRIEDPESWETEVSSMPYEEARHELMKCAGIGPKASDCVLLFAFQKYEAFPVDVWIRRIMQQRYLPELSTGSPLTGREYDAIRRFAREHFGEYCGYAQEYLYGARDG
jgi:N-glycosylase/DNA lyase